MPGGVAPAPRTHPRGDRAGRAGRARGTRPGARGRCQCPRRRREQQPGPAPAGAVLLGLAALRKRRGERAVLRLWVSEGGTEGPGVTVPVGWARTQPGAASPATSSRELRGFCFGELRVPFLATATAPALPAEGGAAPERHLLKVFNHKLIQRHLWGYFQVSVHTCFPLVMHGISFLRRWWLVGTWRHIQL